MVHASAFVVACMIDFVMVKVINSAIVIYIP